VLHRESTGGYSVSFMGGPGSHLIASLALSNCLVVLDEDTTEVTAGSAVTVMPLLLSNR
jgi:molybdopterin molybdotransferase